MEEGLSNVAYFRTDGGSSKLYTQEYVDKQEKEIERLNKELEIAKDNEETYRLEMLDITKRLGLKDDTIFDEVKDKAERLNNIIKEVREYIEEHCVDDEFEINLTRKEKNIKHILEILN